MKSDGGGSGIMKRRIGIWTIAGFLIAGFWALYALASTPPALGRGDPMSTFLCITCPIALIRSYPLSVYFVLVANAATYALIGLIVETLRRRVHHAH